MKTFIYLSILVIAIVVLAALRPVMRLFERRPARPLRLA